MAKSKTDINDWVDVPIDDWQDVPVEETVQQKPQSFTQKRFPFATQGIKQAQQGNPIAGGLNLANQFFSEAGRPFQQADEALRKVPVVGEPLSNILRFPPYLAGKAVELGTDAISATGIPQMLNNLLPLDESGETAQALGTTNQMIAPFTVIPPMAKVAAGVPQIAARASQATADALSQSGYKIPPTVKTSQRTELLRTAQKENIIPTKKGLEKLDNRVSELKQVAEGLEQKAIKSQTQQQTGFGKTIDVEATVPTRDMVQSIDGLMEKWSKSDTPKDFIKVLSDYRNRVLAQQKPVLSIQEMIDLKRNLQKQLSQVYEKQMRINPSIKENLLQEAKSSIETNVRQKLEEIIPDYKNTNSQIHKLLNLKPYVEQAANRISNQDLTSIRLKDLLLGGGIAGVGGDPLSIAGAIIVGRVLTDQRVQAYLGNKFSTGDFFSPQSTGININKFPVSPEFYAEANRLGVRIDNSQPRKGGNPMPLFTDNKTGSTFTIQKGETLADAVARIRKAHSQPRMTWQEALAEQEKRKNK